MVDWTRYIEDKPEEKFVVPKEKKELETKGAILDLDDDFESSRRDIDDAISNANSALVDLIDLAKNSNHPRTYEVLATLIKSISDMSKDRISIHEQRAKIKEKLEGPKTAPAVTQNNTQQNIFIGTTTDFDDFIDKVPLDGFEIENSDRIE